MPFHITGGHLTSATSSDPVVSYTPLEEITGVHWGVWVFAFGAVQLAIPPPWGDFMDHETLTGGITHVAVAGVWPNGFLGRAGKEGTGVGRFYIDPNPNGTQNDPGQLEADLRSLLDRLKGIPIGDPDPTPPEPGSVLRQLALFAYIFNHMPTGPFAPFHKLDMKQTPPIVTPISVTRTFPHTADPADEYEQIEVRVTGMGGFNLKPYRGAGGEVMRLSGAEPQLRDDIYLGEALDVQWTDADLFKAAGVAPLQANNPRGEARDFDWQWPGAGGPPITGDPNADPPK
jgi:hypothetical protein